MLDWLKASQLVGYAPHTWELVHHCSQHCHFFQSEWIFNTLCSEVLQGPRSSPSSAWNVLLAPSQPLFQFLNIITSLKLMANLSLPPSTSAPDVSLPTSIRPLALLSCSHHQLGVDLWHIPNPHNWSDLRMVELTDSSKSHSPCPSTPHGYLVRHTQPWLSPAKWFQDVGPASC